MRFSPFDFDVATSPEEQEAAARRFRQTPPALEKSPQDPAALDPGDNAAERDHSAR